jgi:hypothetical protein
MIYSATPEEVERRRKAFIHKWRLKHRAVADSLQQAGAALHLHATAAKSVTQRSHD